MHKHICRFSTEAEQLEFNLYCESPVATINDENNQICLNPHTIYYISSGNFIPEDIWDHYSNWKISLSKSYYNLVDEIHIYNESDQNTTWYFTVPKQFDYNIYDDQKQQLQNMFFEIIDYNLFGKYKLYKSKTKDRSISIIVSKIY